MGWANFKVPIPSNQFPTYSWNDIPKYIDATTGQLSTSSASGTYIRVPKGKIAFDPVGRIAYVKLVGAYGVHRNSGTVASFGPLLVQAFPQDGSLPAFPSVQEFLPTIYGTSAVAGGQPSLMAVYIMQAGIYYWYRAMDGGSTVVQDFNSPTGVNDFFFLDG